MGNARANSILEKNVPHGLKKPAAANDRQISILNCIFCSDSFPFRAARVKWIVPKYQRDWADDHFFPEFDEEEYKEEENNKGLPTTRPRVNSAGKVAPPPPSAERKPSFGKSTIPGSKVSLEYIIESNNSFQRLQDSHHHQEDLLLLCLLNPINQHQQKEVKVLLPQLCQ